MSEVLERLKKPDRVIVVSGSSPTGWKELTATQYEEKKNNKISLNIDKIKQLSNRESLTY